jgi:hypothetical protein
MIRDFLLSRAAADDGGDQQRIKELRDGFSRPPTVSSQLEDLSRQVLEDGSEVD